MRVSWAALALLLCSPLGARAADPPAREACIEAYGDAQRSMRAGALRSSRATLLLCAREECPPALQHDCAAWLEEVRMRMPTLLVALRGAAGTDVPEARVLVDGALVSPRLDGRELDVDPGEHMVRVEPKGRAPLEKRIVALEREKGREVVFELATIGRLPDPNPVTAAPLGDTAPAAETPAPPWTFWASSGLAAVAVGTFGVFGALGLANRGDLQTCSPACPHDQVQRSRTDFLVADVSLAVAVVSAGAATWLFLTRPAAARPVPPRFGATRAP